MTGIFQWNEWNHFNICILLKDFPIEQMTVLISQKILSYIFIYVYICGWHHRLDGHGFVWTLGVGDGQGGLACCDSWGRKESETWLSDWTELNWTELTDVYVFLSHIYYNKYIFIFIISNKKYILIYNTHIYLWAFPVAQW